MTMKQSLRKSFFTSVAAANVHIVECRVSSDDVCVYCSHVGRNQLLRWKLKVEV